MVLFTIKLTKIEFQNESKRLNNNYSIWNDTTIHADCFGFEQAEPRPHSKVTNQSSDLKYKLVINGWNPNNWILLLYIKIDVNKHTILINFLFIRMQSIGYTQNESYWKLAISFILTKQPLPLWSQRKMLRRRTFLILVAYKHR